MSDLPIVPYKDVAKEKQRFAFIRASDLEFKEPEFIVERLFETDSLSLVFGDPGCGKSFLALGIAACIATGSKFHGRAVKKGTVFFIAGEGHNGLKRRLTAWEKHTGVSLKDASLFMSTIATSLCNEDQVKVVSDAISKLVEIEGIPSLIVIDTVARNFGDGDENSTQDMNKFVSGVDQIRSLYDCTILLIHHSGHSDKARARGAMALKGALDTEYCMTSDSGGVCELTNTKMKDASPPRPAGFQLTTVEIGMNKNGEPITSAVLEEVDAPPKGKKKQQSAAQKLALKTYETAARLHGILDYEGKFCGLHMDDWRLEYYSQSAADNLSAKSKSFLRARESLCERGDLSVKDDVYRLEGNQAEITECLIRDAILKSKLAGQEETCSGHVLFCQPTP